MSLNLENIVQGISKQLKNKLTPTILEEFKEGEFDGQGTYIFIDGEVESGEWKDGKLIKK